MSFLKVLLRGIALLPGLIHGIEAVYGAGTGEQKKQAALEIATSALKMADAVSNKNIVHAEAFSAGLSLLIDGVVACLNASVWAKS